VVAVVKEGAAAAVMVAGGLCILEGMEASEDTAPGISPYFALQPIFRVRVICDELK
jgi:hypothetical protein